LNTTSARFLQAVSGLGPLGNQYNISTVPNIASGTGGLNGCSFMNVPSNDVYIDIGIFAGLLVVPPMYRQKTGGATITNVIKTNLLRYTCGTMIAGAMDAIVDRLGLSIDVWYPSLSPLAIQKNFSIRDALIKMLVTGSADYSLDAPTARKSDGGCYSVLKYSYEAVSGRDWPYTLAANVAMPATRLALYEHFPEVLVDADDVGNLITVPETAGISNFALGGTPYNAYDDYTVWDSQEEMWVWSDRLQASVRKISTFGSSNSGIYLKLR
jgi:hypothetical protein